MPVSSLPGVVRKISLPLQTLFPANLSTARSGFPSRTAKAGMRMARRSRQRPSTGSGIRSVASLRPVSWAVWTRST